MSCHTILGLSHKLQRLKVKCVSVLVIFFAPSYECKFLFAWLAYIKLLRVLITVFALHANTIASIVAAINIQAPYEILPDIAFIVILCSIGLLNITFIGPFVQACFCFIHFFYRIAKFISFCYVILFNEFLYAFYWWLCQSL